MVEFNEDFDEMRVTEVNQSQQGWTFLVELGRGESLIEYYVDVDIDFWTDLTNRRAEPAELVAATFKFLLDKEPKELILKRFNLSEVSSYFPQYEMEMRRIL